MFDLEVELNESLFTTIDVHSGIISCILLIEQLIRRSFVVLPSIPFLVIIGSFSSSVSLSQSWAGEIKDAGIHPAWSTAGAE